jgi:hypothetical protein
LANPAVAVVLGLVAGTGIALLNGYGARHLTADDPTGAGIGMALGMYMIGLVVAAGLMFAYYAVAPGAIAAFGVTLVVVMLGVTLIRLVPAMREMRAGEKGR